MTGIVPLPPFPLDWRNHDEQRTSPTNIPADAECSLRYDNAIQNYKEKSLYDTGVTAEYGDKLITLVTCSYHEEHGRFVVVARQR